MDKKEILRIKIDMNGEAVSMKTENGEVVMIPFAGSVDSALFKGVVLPFGVDTQIVNAAGGRHMSARYMLEGKDEEGQDCHIYIENNGWFEDEVKMPFHTVPTFLTDSRKLAPYLQRNKFVGEGNVKEDGLWITFYEV